MKIKTTLFLHADKEVLREKYRSLCQDYNVAPVSEAESEFSWTGYEIALDIEVDLDTGKATLVGVQGVELKEQVQL